MITLILKFFDVDKKGVVGCEITNQPTPDASEEEAKAVVAVIGFINKGSKSGDIFKKLKDQAEGKSTNVN